MSIRVRKGHMLFASGAAVVAAVAAVSAGEAIPASAQSAAPGGSVSRLSAAPSALAMQLHALWDGAAQSLQMDHDPIVVRAARDAAAALLDAALPVTRKAP